MHLQLHHQHLRQDQADAYRCEGDAGHACAGRGIECEAINGEETHGDLGDGHRDHAQEGRQLRQAQAGIEPRHRCAGTRLCSGHRRRSRQAPGDQCQREQRQQRRHVQRQGEIAIRQPARSGRAQHHAQRIGAAQPRHELRTLAGGGLVGDEGSGGGRHGRIEQADQAACAHQHQHRHQHRRHHLQGNIDEHRQGDVNHGVGGHGQQQHALAADTVTQPAPRARGQHPQHAGGSDREAGVPFGQAEQAHHRPDHRHERHHRHRADQGGKDQGRQTGDDGTCMHGTPAVSKKVPTPAGVKASSNDNGSYLHLIPIRLNGWVTQRLNEGCAAPAGRDGGTTTPAAGSPAEGWPPAAPAHWPTTASAGGWRRTG